MDSPSAHQEPQDSDFHDVEQLPTFQESRGLLSPTHQRFCAELIATEDLNATKAYMAVYPDSSYEAARRSACKLLTHTDIQDEVQRLMDERASVTGITADRVLLRMWQMATADPRELMELRIGCCRYCWGEYHQYQYTEAEAERAEHDHIHAEAKRRKAEKDDFVPRPFPQKGGTGYDRNRRPNPECPECAGEGIHRHVINDTRTLSPGAAMLFAGFKVTEHGTEVKVRDQIQALIKVGEHLGMWSDKLPGPQGVDPLRALLEEIRGTSGVAAALPIVHDDPERRPADVQDVTPKPPAARWKAKSQEPR